MKTCTKCGETKELSEFSFRKVGKDGTLSSCKKCCALAGRKWRAENAERDRAIKKSGVLKMRKGRGL